MFFKREKGLTGRGAGLGPLGTDIPSRHLPGTRKCESCGKTISGNKPRCFRCAQSLEKAQRAVAVGRD